MFPNSYSFNPGVVLDPITMTPMIGGSSFTVNPLGVAAKPEQKVWQKMFIKDIPTQCSNECMIRLLHEFGQVKNFKRANNQRGELLPFCYFDLETGEEILRLRRLFKNIRMLDKTLELKISGETETFIKQWSAIQKDEWRKKLLAPGMNEAKEYPTIEDYHQRDDAKYRQRIEDKLRQVNAQVKRCAIEKMREEEKKQHPRQKQRQKVKRRYQEELIRSFQQQEDYLLKRQRNKEKQYRKLKQRERSNEKAKAKRLEKQAIMTPQQEQKRMSKFLTPERMKAIEKQQMQDYDVLLEQNPPLPQQQMPNVAPTKRVKAYAGQSIEIQQNNNRASDEVVFELQRDENGNKRQVKINRAFQDWDKEEELQRQDAKQIELKLPELQEIETLKQLEKKNKEKERQLQAFIPRNKSDLWLYQIDWDKLSKSVVLERNIRPWLEEQSIQYMGVIEQKFIALVEKRLFSRSKPDKIIKVMQKLIEEDAEQFVVKLWRALILEDLKLRHNL